MTDPPPRAMFKGFGDSSLNFTLLAWVPTIDVGLQAQNALRVAILRKLDRLESPSHRATSMSRPRVMARGR